MIKKPLFAVIGGANFPATPAALKAAKVAVGQTPPVVAIAMGAIDKALAELKATGRMAEAQKGAVSRATRDKVEQVEELDARARKYNLPQRHGLGFGRGTLAAILRPHQRAEGQSWYRAIGGSPIAVRRNRWATSSTTDRASSISAIW